MFHIARVIDGELSHRPEEMPVFKPADVAGWQGRSVEIEGIEVFMFEIEPNADYPMHAVPGDWIGYIVKGSGSLMLEDPKTKNVSSTPYTPGDVFFFGPDLPHAWKSGPEPGASLWVKVR